MYITITLNDSDIDKARESIISYIINTRSKNFGPLFTKIAQTEKCEIWYTYSLYGEVQNANIFFKIMPKNHN